MSKLLEIIAGSSIGNCIVIWEAIRVAYSSLPGTENFYWYGDTVHVSNKDLINNYKILSSGEIS